MYGLQKVSWEEIHKYWELYSLSGPSILNSPIVPVEVSVDYNVNGQYVYGYDWLTHAEFSSRKRLIEKDVIQFLYFTKPTNKGTIHTLRMVIRSRVSFI